MFRALRHRSFRLFSIGQIISLTGTWIQTLATSWLAFELTHSVFWVGVAAFSTQLPYFVLSLFSGVIVDRLPLKKVLIATQIVSLLQATVLAILASLGHLGILEIVAFNFLLGVAANIDLTARQSLMIHLVPAKEDIPNAVALNTMIMNATRMLGPLVAGILISQWGVSVCFAFNALSFLAVLWSLQFVQMAEVGSRGIQAGKFFHQLRDGLQTILRSPGIRQLIFIVIVSSLLIVPSIHLLPSVASYVGRNDPDSLGQLMAINGMGAILAAMFLARHKEPKSYPTIIRSGMRIAGLGVGFSLVFKSFPILGLCVLMTSFGVMLQLTSISTVLQLSSPIGLRSRILSYFIWCMMGFPPFGNFVQAWLSEKWGLLYVISGAGLLALLASFIVPLHRTLNY